MTMQRDDYARITTTIRKVRDQTLEAVEDQHTREVVEQTYRDLALGLAKWFASVNQNFRPDIFLPDALGPDQSQLVLRQFDEFITNRNQRSV